MRLLCEVVLLTADRNLAIKASACNVPVRSVTAFRKWASTGASGPHWKWRGVDGSSCASGKRACQESSSSQSGMWVGEGVNSTGPPEIKSTETSQWNSSSRSSTSSPSRKGALAEHGKDRSYSRSSTSSPSRKGAPAERGKDRCHNRKRRTGGRHSPKSGDEGSKSPKVPPTRNQHPSTGAGRHYRNSARSDRSDSNVTHPAGRHPQSNNNAHAEDFPSLSRGGRGRSARGRGR